MTIRPATRDDLPAFFAYLNDHLSENGADGAALFMPMARGACFLPPDKETAFRAGLETPLGQPGWRRLWLAFGSDGEITGHIDLRARPEHSAAHRVLLGMGVHRHVRRQGLGARLIGIASAWANAEEFAWIDLEVLSANINARQLYLRCGFVQVGELDDMFRIDSQAHGYTLMARNLAILIEKK